MTDFKITPDDVPPPELAQPEIKSDDPTCEVCGVPLVYAGRGRKPKRCPEHRKTSSGSGRPRGTTGDVAAACETMGMIYGGISAALTIVSPTAAGMWAEEIDGLQAMNAQTFAADKALCKSVLKLGQTSARGTFVAAHLFAIAPVAGIARVEWAMKAKERAVKKAARQAARDATDIVDRAASGGTPPGQTPGQSYPRQGFFE